MKYGFLKKQPSKTFKTGALDGGIDYKNHPDNIKDNKLSAAKNMWYKNSRLQTRPGFKGDAACAVNSMLYGYSGELKYNVTDTVIYRHGEYYRLATADVTTDDYAHYTYVYLLDLSGNIEPIGNLSFLRYSSDVFYLPSHINFFTGKPTKGGGIYAMVTLCNTHDISSKTYNIYEINSQFTKWDTVNDYYIPTALINGRGNKYQTAKNENGFSAPSPVTLESQNLLDGRFYAYFTADGCSNSFKLPYNNLTDTEVKCRVYYDIDRYVEWVIAPGFLRDIKSFNDTEIAAYIDRTTGTLYFKAGPNDYPVPIMEMCAENNIKVIASKEIKDGVAKIVGASCVARHNSKLLIAGGENGNTIYTSDYDNPLYFPNGSAIDIGESNSKITHMSSQQGKVLVFKESELHLLTVTEGKVINQISIIRDNDKHFKKGDVFKSEQISSSIGCDNSATVELCNKRNCWVGADNNIYTFDVIGRKLKKVCCCPELELDYLSRRYATAIGGDNYYILVSGKRIAVVDISDPSDYKIFYWEIPEGLNIESGFYFVGEFWFLCTGCNSSLAYIARLQGKNDSILYFADDQNMTIVQDEMPVSCSFTTKHYTFSDVFTNKNIEGVYLNLSAKGKVKIAVNDNYITEVNFGFLNEDYDKCEYKSVRLSPHIYNTDGVTLKLESENDISIGDIEIQYRIMV